MNLTAAAVLAERGLPTAAETPKRLDTAVVRIAVRSEHGEPVEVGEVR